MAQWLAQWTTIGDHRIVFVLSYCIVPLLTQIYKWVLVTEQCGQHAAEITSITVLLNFFDCIFKPFKTPLKRVLGSHRFVVVYIL